MIDEDDLTGLTARLRRIAERERKRADSNARFFEKLIEGHILSITATQHRIVQAVALINAGHVDAGKRLLNDAVRAIDDHIAGLEPSPT
jgi:hypothetical protein